MNNNTNKVMLNGIISTGSLSRIGDSIAFNKSLKAQFNLDDTCDNLVNFTPIEKMSFTKDALIRECLLTRIVRTEILK